MGFSTIWWWEMGIPDRALQQIPPVSLSPGDLQRYLWFEKQKQDAAVCIGGAGRLRQGGVGLN